jgi:O-antigen/teichoic acid export membrane protein
MTDINRNKVKKGIVWVLAQRFFIRVFAFLRVPILARLLSPNDFGLIGIVTAVFLFVDVLTRTGFQIALIQKKENVEEYLDVGWTINLIVNTFETGILIALAKPLANFYHEPELVPLMLLFSSTAVIAGLESIRTVFLYRKLNMGILSIYAIVTSGITFVITVGLVYWFRNVWALVWGMIAQTVLNTIGSYIIAPYRPRFKLDIPKAKELWAYGKWEFLSGLLLTVFMRGDNLFVGKVLGLTALGFYAMAYNVGNIVTTELVDALRGVIFPAFSAIQDDLTRLRASYLTIYHFTASVGCVFAVGLSLLAPQFVDIVLGAQWLQIIPTLQVLAIWGGVQMLSTSTAPLFRAVNRPDWFTKVQAVKLFFLALLIYPFSIWWGITGTAFAALLAAMLEIPVGLLWTRQALECRYRDILLPLIAPFTGALVVSAVYVRTWDMLNIPSLPHLLLFGILILVLYVTVTLMIDRYLKAGLWLTVRNIIGV